MTYRSAGARAVALARTERAFQCAEDKRQTASVGPATVSERAAPFDMQLPSIVQHLSVLEQSRLVRSKKRGRVRTYEIAPERFKIVDDWLNARRQLWETRLDRFDQHVRQLKEKESKS